jgi:hypothetical protein
MITHPFAPPGRGSLVIIFKFFTEQKQSIKSFSDLCWKLVAGS